MNDYPAYLGRVCVYCEEWTPSMDEPCKTCGEAPFNTAGKVPCPWKAQHKKGSKCPACKGVNWVEELV